MQSHKTAALLILYACLGVLFYAAVANAYPDVGAPLNLEDHVTGLFIINATGNGTVNGFFLNAGNNTSRQEIYMYLRPGKRYTVEINEVRE